MRATQEKFELFKVKSADQETELRESLRSTRELLTKTRAELTLTANELESVRGEAAFAYKAAGKQTETATQALKKQRTELQAANEKLEERQTRLLEDIEAKNKEIMKLKCLVRDL